MGQGEGSGQGCGSGILKCILVILNIIFGLVGAILLAVGIFIKVGLDRVMEQVGVTDQLSSLTKYAEDLGLQNSASMPAGTSINFSELLGPMAIPFIVLGALLFISSFFGCCGACCSSKCLLIIYIVICSVLLLVQIILVGLFFGGKLEPEIRKQVQKRIDSDFRGIDSFDVWSLAFNFVMSKFACCGIDDYEDFKTAANWQKNRTFEVTVSGTTVKQTYTLKTPMACCKFSGTFPDLGSPIDESCAWAPNDLNNNWKTSCWNKVNEEVKKYKSQALGGLIGVILAQLVVIVVVAILLFLMEQDKIGVV